MRYIRKTTIEYGLHLPAFVKDVVSGRRAPFRAYIEDVKNDWLNEMLDYEMQFSSGNIVALNTLNVVPPISKKTFINLYNKAGNEREFINDLRKDNAGELCPYCGGPECGTIDHYYPKDKVPQFSISPDNLIPCCSNCNRIKDEKMPVGNNQRFWNVYYDKFLKKVILECVFTVIGNHIQIDIKPSSLLSLVEQDIVSFHINNLDIKNRLGSYVRAEFNSHRDKMKRDIRNGRSESDIIDEYNYVVNQAVSRGDQNMWSIIIKDSIRRIPQNFLVCIS